MNVKTIVPPLLVLLPIFAAAGEFDGIIGTYLEVSTVCDTATPKGIPKQQCTQATNELRIAPSEEGLPLLTIRAVFVSGQGQVCEFTGNGFWNRRDRVTVKNSATGCEMTLIHNLNSIHTVVLTREECRSHCGAHSSLDEHVLKRPR